WREIHVAARGSNILTEDDQLALLRAHVEIGLRDVGGDRHERPVVCVLKGLGISGLRLDLPPELAYKVKFLVGIEATRFVNTAKILGVFRRPQRLRHPALGFIRSRSD